MLRPRRVCWCWSSRIQQLHQQNRGWGGVDVQVQSVAVHSVFSRGWVLQVQSMAVHREDVTLTLVCAWHHFFAKVRKKCHQSLENGFMGRQCLTCLDLTMAFTTSHMDSTQFISMRDVISPLTSPPASSVNGTGPATEESDMHAGVPGGHHMPQMHGAHGIMMSFASVGGALPPPSEVYGCPLS